MRRLCFPTSKRLYLSSPLLCSGGVSWSRKYQRVTIYCVSRLCPGSVSRPRSYQSVEIYRVPAAVQVVFPAPEIIKVSPFILLCPRVVSRPRSYQSVTIESLFFRFPPCPSGVPRSRSLAIYRLPPQPMSCFLFSKLPEYNYFSLFSLLPQWFPGTLQNQRRAVAPLKGYSIANELNAFCCPICWIYTKFDMNL